MATIFPTAGERLIAMRYLRTGGGSSFVSFMAVFSFIGVALGVAALIVVLSVMGGFRSQLIERLTSINGHIVVSAKQGMLTDATRLAERIATVPYVASVTPVLEIQGLATANGQASAVVMRGVSAQSLEARLSASGSTVLGDASQFATRTGVVLGERLRQFLGVRPDDVLQIITYRRAAKTSVPQPADFEVLASFATGRAEIDSSMLYVPLDLLQEDLELAPGTASSIEIGLKDAAIAPQVAADIARHLAGSNVVVQDWRIRNARYVDALELERTMMFIILSLVVVVAVMNIIASFAMLVVNKTAGIAILRTMGAARGALLRVFFLAGCSVGLAGTIVGAGLGVAIAANMPRIAGSLSRATGGGSAEIEFINAMPARINPGEVAAILIVAALLSIAAAIYPALRAARLDPVEGLRHG